MGPTPTHPNRTTRGIPAAYKITQVVYSEDSLDVAVVGGGPAGVVSALRAARLGARTALITRDELGGVAAHDGPVPVRTLAHAARLLREARQLPRYGIAVGEPALDYARLLDRVSEVTADVGARSLFREELRERGVTVYERAGGVRFIDPHVVETERGRRIRAETIILCTGGRSRQLDIPGFELTATHSDAWALSSVPPSMLVVGAGATGVQVASIFNAFGSRVTLFEAGPRILPTEDQDVAETVRSALQELGVEVLERAGRIKRFERSSTGVKLLYDKGDSEGQIEASLAVAAVGWVANTTGLDLAAAGVATDGRGYVQVDSQLRTTAPQIFAAGDITGQVMVVHEAVRQAYLAATNAVLGTVQALPAEVSPIGSFTDPEYASVGLSEAMAGDSHEVVVATESFDSLPRPIIDGRTRGFCKLIADRSRHTILGCHIVGESAVEIAQLAALAIASQMTVEQLALVPFSFPTFAGALSRAAVRASAQLGDATGRTDEDIRLKSGVAGQPTTEPAPNR